MKKMTEMLTGYRSYLQQKEFVAENVTRYSSRTRHFITWIHRQGTAEITYNTLLRYIGHCRSEKKSNATINKYLLSVRHFFDYLEREEIRWLHPAGFNPARNLQVRGVKQQPFHDPLSKEELEDLYHRYEGRNKVILGLLVYQGLKTGEMEKLRKSDVDLTHAQLQVPSTRGGCSRILKLAAEQIMQLSAQLHSHPGELLLGERLQNRIQRLMRKLRKQYPKVRTAKHLRGSLIVYWIKSYNLQKAQYLAGHKNILSTELYLQTDIEELKKALEQYHPLK